jgi:hypothetical protein
MLFNHDLKMVFLHVPKTGGTSIMEAFQRMGHKFTTLSNKHYSYAQERRHIEAGLPSELREDMSGYWWFTVVRDPYHRAVSQYFQQIKVLRRKVDPTRVQNLRIGAKGQAVEHYRERLARTTRMGFHEWWWGPNHNEHSRVSNWDVVGSCPHPVQVYRFEQGIERIMGDLRDRWGLPGLEVLHGNRNSVDVSELRVPSRDYMAHHTQGTIGSVNRVWGEDFDRFGYARLDPRLFPDSPSV